MDKPYDTPRDPFYVWLTREYPSRQFSADELWLMKRAWGAARAFESASAGNPL